MRFKFLKNKILSSVFLSFFFCFLISSPPVFAQNPETGGGGSAGGTAQPTSGCGPSASHCYASWNTGYDLTTGAGGEWLRIPMERLEERGLRDRNAIPYNIVGQIPHVNYDPNKLNYRGDPKIITGCGQATHIYVFISHRYENRPPFKPTGDGYGPNKFYWFNFPDAPRVTTPTTPNNLLRPEQKYVNRAEEYHADYEEAHAVFEKYKAHSGRQDISWEKGDFAWFCEFNWGNIPPTQPCDPSDPNCHKPNPNPDPDPDPDSTTIDCGLDLPGVSNSNKKGNTVADSSIINLSYTGTQDYRNWQRSIQGKNFVLARPGDTIRFRHSLCFTAQGVGKNLNGNNGIRDANRFSIYAKRNNADDNRYLFGRSELLDGSQRTVQGYDNTKPIQGTGITPAKEFGFTTKSPTASPNPDYLCNSNIFTSNNNRGIKNGYQIPGFASGVSNCSAASQTGNSSEVGNTISQGIRYNDVRGWVNWRTEYGGFCGCNMGPGSLGSAWSRQHQSFSYDTAESAPGHWGKIDNYCRHESDDCGEDDDEPYYVREHHESFPVDSEDLGNKETEVKAYIPYNFNTFVTSEIEASDVAFTGEQVDISGTYHILPRQNELVSKTQYATHTSDKETFRLYEMLIPLGQNVYTLSGNERSDNDVCRYYGISRCNLVNTTKGHMNASGNYSGESKNSSIFSRTIPDNEEYIGYKYCVASSIWPASSHQSSSNSINENISGAAMSGGDESKYNVSDLSCITIAKKPNFQVWGGGMFTNGNIETSVSKKTIGSSFNSYPSATEKLFGSWDEYHVIAGGNVAGFGSGASLGYEKGYNYTLPSGGRTLPGSDIYKLTIANRDTTGQSGIPGLPSGLLSRLKARYRDNIAKNNSLKITTHATGLQNIYLKGDINLSQIQLPDQNPDADSTLHRENNAFYKTLTTNEHKNNTLVLYVDGALTIDQNLCYSSNSYNCNAFPSTIQGTYADIRTNSISSLPQILIFAKKVNVLSQVNRIDAWLILDEDHADNNIDTCADFSEPNATQCSETLIFNGPVFAKSLTLRRTGGANHHTGNSTGISADARLLGTRYQKVSGTYYAVSQDGSIAPAEIFNLRSDAYYWGMSQAQRSGIAEVVYQRELAPRY